jgi:dipeptidyl aminopeptidase/acylaminoacyl peptidase
MRKYLESIRMKRLFALISTALFILLVALTSPAQPQRTMMPADTLRVASVSDTQISPNGEWVVYTVSTTEADATRNTLWLVRARGSAAILRSTEDDSTSERAAPAQLLAPTWSASNPRWSPDGKRIAFRATQQERSGIWVVSLEDRQPRFVAPVRETNFFITYAGESLAWSPDSRRIAFISATEEARAGERPDVARTSSRAEAQDDPRVIDRIQYKSRTSFSDRARTHVWVADADSSSTDDARVIRQLTSGPFYDHALTWSPRGDEVAFLSNHEPDPDAFNNSDIFAVDMSGRVREITETRGCEYEPAWSPDGKWIAYTATKREVTTIDSVAEDAHVWVIEAGGGAGRELTAAQDRRARSPHWSPDGNAIFYLAGDHGRTTIYRASLNDRRIQAFTMWGDQRGEMRSLFVTNRPSSDETDNIRNLREYRSFQIGSFSVAYKVFHVGAVGRGISFNPIAFTLSDALDPAEVYLAPGPVVPVLRLSAHNDQLTRPMRFSPPEEINFESFDSTPIQGWLMKPAGWREDRRYPLILSIHGGPHGMYGYAFNPTFQVYAARGYAVLYLNPRGSSGYGQKFSDGTLREWGGGDYRDLMMGVDEVLRTRSWIDPERMGVTGGSYGGFMTNWVITQTTRFKAAVAQASVSNLISFYATSLYQDLIHAEFGGFPWDDYDLLWRWSPLRYVKQAQTPTLLIHGEADNDVHITQAEEMYTALKRRGIEAVLVRYPREGHGLREPRHRLDALERTLAWFDRFLK